jgi:hypothetical protein
MSPEVLIVAIAVAAAWTLLGKPDAWWKEEKVPKPSKILLTILVVLAVGLAYLNRLMSRIEEES